MSKMPISSEQWRGTTGSLNPRRRFRSPPSLTETRSSLCCYPVPPSNWKGYHAAVILLCTLLLYNLYQLCTAAMTSGETLDFCTCASKGLVGITDVDYTSLNVSYRFGSFPFFILLLNDVILYVAMVIAVVLVGVQEHRGRDEHQWKFTQQLHHLDFFWLTSGQNREIIYDPVTGGCCVTLLLSSTHSERTLPCKCSLKVTWCKVPPQSLGKRSFIILQLSTIVMAMLLLLAGDVERNPGPLTVLSEKDVVTLTEILATHASKWRGIGLQLGFTVSELKSIATPPGQEAIDYLTTMLDKWVHRTSGVTLENLERALRSKTVGLGTVADELQTEWQKVQKESTSPQNDDVHTPYDHTQHFASSSSGHRKRKFHTTSAAAKRRPYDAMLYNAPHTLSTSCLYLTEEKRQSNHECVHSNVTPSTIDPEQAVKDYTSYLQAYYVHHCPTGDAIKWPPLIPKTYHNLAVIGTSNMSRQQQREFQEATVHGTIDDILSEKSPILLKDILQPNKIKRNGEQLKEYPIKTLLLEGAPGTGKSTMSQEMCRSWGNDEFFQEYSLVVMLRFRDPWVQQVKSLSDIFRFPGSEEKQHPVAEYFKQTNGKGLLLILEGYDEAPGSLQNEGSFLFQLIKGILLPSATVMVTSRPSASATLRQYCKVQSSRRVELLGFTKEEVNSYIESHFSDEEMKRDFFSYLDLYPHIHSMMYVPLNSAIVTHVYEECKEINTIVPKTMTQLYSTLVKILLLRELNDPNQRYPNNFNDLPEHVYENFCKVCKLAYNGIVKMTTEIIFQDLPEDFDHLGLMQSVPEMYMCLDRRTSRSYNFLHLTIQEILAAYHLSLLGVDEQVAFLNEHFEDRATVSKFLAGLSPHSVPLLDAACKTSKGDTIKFNVSLSVLHLVFESNNPCALSDVVAAETDAIITFNTDTCNQPFDFYILGFCIVSSNCCSKLNFSEDDHHNTALFVKGMKSFQTAITNSRSQVLRIRIYKGVRSLLGDDINILCTAPFNRLFQNATHFDLSRALTFFDYSVNQYFDQFVVKSMHYLSNLQCLNIDDNTNIGSGKVARLCKCLPKSIISLSMRSIGIGDEDCKALGDLLSSASYAIEYLDIGLNFLFPSGVQLIIDGLSQNTSLKELHMEFSTFSHANIASLAEALKSNASLVALNIRNCNIDTNDVVTLAGVLEVNTALQYLNLSNVDTDKIDVDDGELDGFAELHQRIENKIETSGYSSLAHMLTVNTSLTSLRLEFCNVQNKDGIALSNALTRNNTLKLLSLNFNPIGDETLDALGAMLEVNTSIILLELDMESNQFTMAGIRQLISRVRQHNTTLKGLLFSSNNKEEDSMFESLEESIDAFSSFLSSQHSLDALRQEAYQHHRDSNYYYPSAADSNVQASLKVYYWSSSTFHSPSITIPDNILKPSNTTTTS